MAILSREVDKASKYSSGSCQLVRVMDVGNDENEMDNDVGYGDDDGISERRRGMSE